MVKRIVRDVCIISGILVLWASGSHMAMEFLSKRRLIDKWWGAKRNTSGDLVEMAFLESVKTFNSVDDSVSGKYNKYTGEPYSVLYLYGDSYVWNVGASFFRGIKDYHFINRYDGGEYTLDKSVNNILIMEISERDVRVHFNTLRTINDLRISCKYRCDKAITPILKKRVSYSSVFTDITIKDIFNPRANQNLEYNLFHYNFILSLFEWKAALNYFLFKRASGGIVISDDGRSLFLRGTVNKDDNHSSYNPVSDDEIALIIQNLNDIYNHYKSVGFNEVYLSIIPNPATILQPAGYNRLITRIENNKCLKMKTIDIYNIFKFSGRLYYKPGDSHWSKRGRQAWIDMVNDTLLKHASGANN